jgi:hypothetical protein
MIRLHVGLTRKVGQANYGSKGGSVSLEVEMADLEPQKIRDYIHRLFNLAKVSLEDELGREGMDIQEQPRVQVEIAPPGPGLGQAVQDPAKLLSEKQSRYLKMLADKQRWNLTKECQERFGKEWPAITSKEASQLINEWSNLLIRER